MLFVLIFRKGKDPMLISQGNNRRWQLPPPIPIIVARRLEMLEPKKFDDFASRKGVKGG